jgi:murein DD-endopeptidase MepM/ murein hydrolase activator NlpD
VSLSQQQQGVARIIYAAARKAGLPDARARELVAASYAESGLNPNARNKSSGAAGLFQLLSPGYVSNANAHGGVYSPQANIGAILPQYQRYWQQHPNAAPGEAGRDVELSGEGAGFYSHPLGTIGKFGGAPPANPPIAAAAAPDALKLALLKQLQSGNVNFLQLAASKKFVPRAAASPQPPRTTGVPTDTSPGPSGEPVHGKMIGTPYQGTHTLGNWESDNAIDVATPIGTPIRAPFNGVVGTQIGSLGSTNPRFAGLRVHVKGGKDEWYGAHLSRLIVKAGQHVRAGQIIGYSGAANGVAHLHEALHYGDPRRLDK